MFSHIKELFTRPSGYQISRSVRFRSSATAYFNRTLTTPTSAKAWTFSAWVKRGKIGVAQSIFISTLGGAGVPQASSIFTANDTIEVYDYNGAAYTFDVITSQVFRDPSAWYHLIFVYDSANATASNRARLYVNGIQITAFSSATYPTLNTDSGAFNRAYTHYLSQSNAQYFDGYITEANFIDGQALTPSSFGETNAVTGVWQPKKYAGTYGTNGFYLNFSDNSAATAAAIGKDYSGNGNNWTPSAGISVTAGVTYDSMIDSPTSFPDGSTGRGNYAVFNPINTNSFTITGGNLDGSVTGGTAKVAVGTIGVSSGKWYWEVVGTSGINLMIGVANSAVAITSSSWTTANGWAYYLDGQKFNNNTSVAYGSSYVANDIIGVALDMDTGTLVFYKNNTSQGTAFNTGLSGKTIVPAIFNGSSGNTQAYSINFGQRPFTYTPPTGYVALNTQNLPTPTISNGASYMAATTYTGTGSALTVANTVGSASFQPDWVWVKSRSAATDHALYDSVRGVQKQLESNTTTAETTETTGLTAFGTTGFTIGALAQMNTSAATYVGWQWKGGGTAVSNTSGSITSTVSAGATQGFSVVTYTGNNTAGATIGHGLGVSPSMIIVKKRSAVSDWPVYHSSLGATGELVLNSTTAFITITGVWNNTAPTSSVFSVGGGGASGSADVNTSGATFVAYCFAAVAGYSAFGSYTGNGSADGPFVYLGFRPRFIMFKRTDAVASWRIIDTAREPINATQTEIYPNLANAEASAANGMDILSNGFKLRGSYAEWNTNGGTYIYACFAENPFKNSLAR